MTGSALSHIAIYPGSFDPMTFGHLDVVRRARQMFDHLIVGIGVNPEKPTLFSVKSRINMTKRLIDELVAEDDSGSTVEVESYEGLTVDFARKKQACALIRGIRNISDLAMECQLAITNRQVADIETVFVVTGEPYAYTSSSLIRQVAAMGGDVNRLNSIVPQIVIDRLRKLQADPKTPLQKLVRDDSIE